jgi:hypothetical protein
VDASRNERRCAARCAAMAMACMIRDLGRDVVARHRERSLTSRTTVRAGSATVSTPRPTCSRVTTADGRSPGSRVTTFRRLPGTREPSGMMTDDSPLTVAGAAAASAIHRLTAFPIDPRREPSTVSVRTPEGTCQHR